MFFGNALMTNYTPINGENIFVQYLTVFVAKYVLQTINCAAKILLFFECCNSNVLFFL